MAVVCNTRCLNSDLTGVQRYTQKLLNAFPEKINLLSPDPRNSRGIKGHLWEQAILPLKLRKELLWSPSNSGPVFYKRQIVTLHDVVSLDHPEWFNKTYYDWYKQILPLVCKNSAHIITISEFSRKRIIELLNVSESKITVIYNGVDHDLTDLQSGVPPFQVPFKRYVLSLGSLEPRKNIPLLLRAWKNIASRIPEGIGLVIVGGKGNSKIFRDAGIDPQQERVFFTGHVIDSHITQLFRNSMLFVYLSLYEGFGLPPLEAMSAGVPVLTGDQTSLPEVVGEGGYMIDPYSQIECEYALVRLINDGAARDRLAAQGILNATKFDWRETATKTWQVLQKFNS